MAVTVRRGRITDKSEQVALGDSRAMTKAMVLVILACATIAEATGCESSKTAEPTPTSACTDLGGTLGSDDFCDVHSATTAYRITIRFPTGYRDEAAVVGCLKQRRGEFVDWVKANASANTNANADRTGAHRYELNITGNAYQSGNRQHGTQSLVLTIGSDTGVHPVMTYQAFNYSLSNNKPIDFGALFTAGSDPLPTLNRIVGQKIIARDRTATKAANALTAASYQQFAITDDAIIFFLNQDGVMPHEDGPLEVPVPRSELASMLS